MNKKGFTLIELLAVIVILAIIALIATPAVLNIIEDSRKGAAEASARNIINAAKTYYMQSTMNGKTPATIDLSETTLKYDGDQATKGYIIFTDGKPSGKMYISGYCVEINIDGTVASEKVNSNECDVTVPIVYTKYIDGTPLLFDPVNNRKCETSIGSTTGTNNGCMKWYAFLDSETSSTVNLILDHNTTKSVTRDIANDRASSIDAVNAQFQTDITNWNVTVKSTARLITAEEINQIAPADSTHAWNVNTYNGGYYLHTGKNHANGGMYNGAAGSNTYAWLFDITYMCEQYGCNTQDANTFGYYTSSLSGSYLWYVDYFGNFNSYVTGNGYGIRPVITVDKSVFAQ